MSAVRERLGVLCDQITRHPDLREQIHDAGAGDQLDEILAAVGASATIDEQQLIGLLDQIEHKSAVSGLAGVTTVNKGFPTLPPGIDPAQKTEPLNWVCPIAFHCARVVFHDEATTPPRCVAGGGMPMAAKRILG